MVQLVGHPLLIFTFLFVSLCVFLFGYDQGVFSSIITTPRFKDQFDNPSAVEIGSIVAILEIGALITSLFLSLIADKLGRRRTTRLGAFIFSIGGLVQSVAGKTWHLFIGRFISGLGIGLLSGTAPTYIVEISPASLRGTLATAQFTVNVAGYSSSIWIDYFSSGLNSNWSFRLPLFLQVVFGSILFLGTFLLVESPRWLLQHDHDEEGLIVLADLFANGEVHSQEAINHFTEIKQDVLISKLDPPLSLLQTIHRYPRRILMGCSSQLFAQFNGINLISYYAPLVFESAGWEGIKAIEMTGYNSIVYLLSTIPPWYLVENWGRKPLLIIGGFGMMSSLVLVAYCSSWGTLDGAFLVVIFVIIYNALFGLSWGPIPWLLAPEVLPTKARASGASMATATNWLCNFIVGELAPIALEKLHWRLYLIHALSCLISIIVVNFVYVETKGVKLEDLDSMFDDASTATTASIRSRTSSHTTTSRPLLDSSHNPIITGSGNNEVQIPSLNAIQKFKSETSSLRSFNIV